MKTFNDLDYMDDETNDFDRGLLLVKIHLNNLNFVLNSISALNKPDKIALDLKKKSKILYFDKTKDVKIKRRYRRGEAKAL